MKKFMFFFIKVVLFSTIVSSVTAQQIGVGITFNDHENFKSGLAVNVQGDIISLNAKKSFAIIYDMQYKSVKAFDDFINVSQNFRSGNIGVGVKYVYERKAEISLQGGVSLNSIPTFTDNSQPDSFILYEFDNATGSYFGTTLQYNIWLTDKLATFIQYQLNFNFFSPEYETIYWDDAGNMVFDKWTVDYKFQEQTFSVGLKFQL